MRYFGALLHLRNPHLDYKASARRFDLYVLCDLRSAADHLERRKRRKLSISWK